MRINRRELLQSGIAATVAAAATRTKAAGPFDHPTATFSADKARKLPAWAFTEKLFIPPTPIATRIGDFADIHDQPGVFGSQDPRVVGDVFHGVAVEWAQTPPHWKNYGCDPIQDDPALAWQDKQAHFGQIKRFDSDTEKINNWCGFPIKCFKVPITVEHIRLNPNWKPTRLYTYGGMVPGPTFKFRLGQPAVVRYENHLEAEVSVHLHGGHSPSHSDGFPTFYVLQGMARDYFYPNICPLKRTNGDRGCYAPDTAEAQSTMWYHDHGMDATGYNVSKGLAGFALAFGEDELKLINERVLPGLGPESCVDPETEAFQSDNWANYKPEEHSEYPGYYAIGAEPYANPYDLPLVLQDKVIDQNSHQIAFDTNAHDGYLGDTFFVNGVPWPKSEVDRRKYRLRILNGSNARVYNLRLLSESQFRRAQQVGFKEQEWEDNSLPYLRIGKDSWLWPRAEQMKSLVLAMANRADLVVDFKSLADQLEPGEREHFYLVNTMPQTDGRGPKEELTDPGDPRVIPVPFGTADIPLPELRHPIALMRFEVTGPEAPLGEEATVVAGTPLVDKHPIPDNDVRVVREFIFHRSKGAWQINSRFYDPTISNASPTLDTAEEWVFRNGGGGWWHPIHVHLESHQIVRYEKDFDADKIVDPREPPDIIRLDRLDNLTDELPEGERVGYHDTTVLGPNTVVRVRLRFRTWKGPFVFHCHNLEHEDMRMMFNFEPKHSVAGRNETPNPDPNVAPASRTHGNDLTWQGRSEQHPDGAVGELLWEFPPIPASPVSIGDENVIPPYKAP